MRNFFRILLITISSFVFTDIEAQRYNFKPVSLPGNGSWGLVTDMAQDAEDNLWFTSWNGLFKYDGSTFTGYKPDLFNPASIAALDPQTVCVDRTGFIWVGTKVGLDRLDPQTGIFTHFRSNRKDSNSLPGDYINIVRQDHDGNIWIGTGNGLSRFVEKTGGFITYRYNPHDSNSLSNNTVTAIYEDKQGTLWVGTGSTFDHSPGGGLNRMDRQTGKFTRYVHKDEDSTTLIDNRVSAIMEDSHGTFWVGTGGDGLHTMDRSSGTFKRLQYDPVKPGNVSRSSFVKNKDPEDHITFITEDVTGIMWIGTQQGGLTRYDRVKGTTVHYNSDEKNNTSFFTDKEFWKAYTSTDGLLWMSTWEGNLYKIDPYQRPSLFFPFDLAANTSEGGGAVYEENPQTIWIGTDKGLFRKNLLNNTQKQFVHDPNDPGSISDDSITVIVKDAEQKLWVGTRKGINCFDPENNRFTVYKQDAGDKNSLRGDSVNAIYEDHRKNLWIGTFGGGLNLIDRKTGKFKHFINDPADSTSISSDFVTAICEDNSQQLWIGAWPGGLNLFDPVSQRFKHFLGIYNVSSLYQDKAGVLWVGTDAGLFLRDNQSGNFTEFSDPVSGNKITQPVLGIIEDKQGTLWMRCRDYIMRLNNKRDDLKILGEEWGVGINQYAKAHAMIGQQGNVIFSDANGYYSFYPDQIVMDFFKPPRPLLTELRVQNKTIKAGSDILDKPLSEIDEIHLKYNQNTFSFDFKAVDFRSDGNNQFLYMLENYDHTWRAAGTDRTANYYNIVPGVYTFRVKAGSSIGQWAEKSVKIIILPPWWETWWFRVLSLIALIAVIYAIVKERSRKLKAENLLLEQKVNERTAELKKSLQELRATQAQLIQSEKMASLGELTAGIAHEIQNPLNFVNNFSEVNKELLIEMNEELEKGNINEAKEINKGLMDNEEKILHHGKRADSIVKGMLQHSRASSGQKELTDINKLADEYLRLSYHGMRARDKSFNAEMKTDFDESIGKINVVPQDIGRVLLNLFNNAFYAVNEKKKTAGEDHNPEVSVQTKKLNDKIEIRVSDNGNGIPQNIVDKIFQPFFTTKPTGQGTGLGLSLAYDIIKAHGGEIKVESRELEGTEFIVGLPA